MKNNTYETLQEIKKHGRPDFLFNIYPCTIPMDFAEVSVHWHDDVEFISVRKGCGIVELDFTPHTVTAGDLILIRPSQLHAIKPLDNNAMEYENIMLNPSFFLSYQLDACTQEYFIPFIEGLYHLPSIFHREDSCYSSLMKCITHIDDLCSAKEFAWQIGVKSTLFEFFYLLFSNFPYEQPRHLDEKKYMALKDIITFVDDNYTHPISVEDAAAKLGYSQSHFMRFFKQQTNMTFVTYLNNYRLAKAAEALSTTSDSILEIAGNCGYDNLSLFNRQFKRKHQMTPSAFREMYL
ncbi:MAG: AraC family transcriptional regulator [Lachnospiraceae bacterium]|nr:AraC family transcriptional regulator [Lachnospiraceae bacterium]